MLLELARLCWSVCEAAATVSKNKVELRIWLVHAKTSDWIVVTNELRVGRAVILYLFEGRKVVFRKSLN
jgi:hypothetical protein